MVWFMIGHLFTTLFAWVQIGRLPEQEKDLEIMLLRQQLDILECRLDKRIRISKVEKLTLSLLTTKLKATMKQSTARLREVIRLFQPETVLKWHRELVRRKWTYRPPKRGERPRTSVELETLIVRFVGENPDWGYGKLEGELATFDGALQDPTAGLRFLHGRNAILANSVCAVFYRASDAAGVSGGLHKSSRCCVGDSTGTTDGLAVGRP